MRIGGSAMIVLLSSFLGAQIGQAGTLSIAFDLSPSTLQAGNLPVGPSSGLLLVTLTDVDSAGMPFGPAPSGTVRGLTASTSLELVSPQLMISWRFDLMQIGLVGSAFDGMTLSIDPMALTFNPGLAARASAPQASVIG